MDEGLLLERRHGSATFDLNSHVVSSAAPLFWAALSYQCIRRCWKGTVSPAGLSTVRPLRFTAISLTVLLFTVQTYSQHDLVTVLLLTVQTYSQHDLLTVLLFTMRACTRYDVLTVLLVIIRVCIAT